MNKTAKGHEFIQRLSDPERRNNQAIRWARRIAIYEYAKNNPGEIAVKTADELAEKLGVSQRTFYRDIKAIRAAVAFLDRLEIK